MSPLLSVLSIVLLLAGVSSHLALFVTIKQYRRAPPALKPALNNTPHRHIYRSGPDERSSVVHVTLAEKGTLDLHLTSKQAPGRN